ncbi:SDR family oxidoreductase [Acidithiobacillus ferrooxidans]|uniref:SDR family oxidoreductase n=1 Tax=Acidithiobacillus ferrooxidans TaxID=920 RepID=UPI001D02E71B|nr:SDR family NAD(P)-dependent oxidoreductase [Acidithiobacillus ferrooxidans]
MQDLCGKVAVITGASSGIGEASARLLVAEGMQVVLAARRQDRLQKLARELGDAALVVPTDLSNPEEVTHLFEEAGLRN